MYILQLESWIHLTLSKIVEVISPLGSRAILAKYPPNQGLTRARRYGRKMIGQADGPGSCSRLRPSKTCFKLAVS